MFLRLIIQNINREEGNIQNPKTMMFFYNDASSFKPSQSQMEHLANEKDISKNLYSSKQLDKMVSNELINENTTLPSSTSGDRNNLNLSDKNSSSTNIFNYLENTSVASLKKVKKTCKIQIPKEKQTRKRKEKPKI
jgi:hypothetical protein